MQWIKVSKHSILQFALRNYNITTARTVHHPPSTMEQSGCKNQIDANVEIHSNMSFICWEFWNMFCVALLPWLGAKWKCLKRSARKCRLQIAHCTLCLFHIQSFGLLHVLNWNLRYSLCAYISNDFLFWIFKAV